jgi:hypothetical protein
VTEPVRATLRFLRKMTLEPDALTAEDASAVLAAGVSERALRDAITVAFHFNLVDRVADALGFDALDERGRADSARSLVRFGYELPGPLRLLARRPTW